MSGGISDAAEIVTLQLQEQHDFAILATDGVWGPLGGGSMEQLHQSSEQVACLVSQARREAGQSFAMRCASFAKVENVPRNVTRLS